MVFQRNPVEGLMSLPVGFMFIQVGFIFLPVGFMFLPVCLICLLLCIIFLVVSFFSEALIFCYFSSNRPFYTLLKRAIKFKLESFSVEFKALLYPQDSLQAFFCSQFSALLNFAQDSRFVFFAALSPCYLIIKQKNIGLICFYIQ